MAKENVSLFEIFGPVMIGPSSSHTAGVARIAYLARRM
ncbi:MAG: serine dehydratase, partial [Treponema sp.]|nr:serine dehydratase [Treponema sp.]